MRISGPTCILIKHDRRPTLGLAPPDAVLDIDVSLRHIDVTMGVAECAGLCKLSSAYLTHVEESTARVAGGVPEVKASPIKPLFRENFWYLDGPHVPGDTHSRELSFDSLSNLLEQVKCSTNDCRCQCFFVSRGVKYGVSMCAIELQRLSSAGTSNASVFRSIVSRFVSNTVCTSPRSPRRRRRRQ